MIAHLDDILRPETSNKFSNHNKSNEINYSDFTKIVFEICQKKVVPLFFVEEPKIKQIFNTVDFAKLNSQDFLSFGHIFSNKLIYQNTDEEQIDKYLK